MGRHCDGTPIHALWGIPAPRRAPHTITGRHRAVPPPRHRLDHPDERDHFPDEYRTGARRHAGA
jgi:hypothetical protein